MDANYSDDETSNSNNFSPTYNIRPKTHVQYSAATIPGAVTTSNEPTLKEALPSPERSHWFQAITEELEQLNEMELGNMISLPWSLCIPSGIVLKLKRKSKGLPAHFKGGVVARANIQSIAVDYLELYATIAYIELELLLTSIALALGWEIHQVYTERAFLHASIPTPDVIWIKLPNSEGLLDSGEIVRPIKSLNGLRKAQKLCY